MSDMNVYSLFTLFTKILSAAPMPAKPDLIVGLEGELAAALG